MNPQEPYKSVASGWLSMMSLGPTLLLEARQDLMEHWQGKEDTGLKAG